MRLFRINSYRNGSARIDSEDNLTYTVKVTAGEDNTHTLTHVKVTDVFDNDSQSKVDLSSMKLAEATIDGENIAPRCVPVLDDQTEYMDGISETFQLAKVLLLLLK